MPDGVGERVSDVEGVPVVLADRDALGVAVADGVREPLALTVCERVGACDVVTDADCVAVREALGVTVALGVAEADAVPV